MKKQIFELRDKVKSGEFTLEEAHKKFLVTYNVSYCHECNKPYDDRDREHAMCHKCWQPIIEELTEPLILRNITYSIQDGVMIVDEDNLICRRIINGCQ